jgi:hypothetical protein
MVVTSLRVVARFGIGDDIHVIPNSGFSSLMRASSHKCRHILSKLQEFKTSDGMQVGQAAFCSLSVDLTLRYSPFVEDHCLYKSSNTFGISSSGSSTPGGLSRSYEIGTDRIILLQFHCQQQHIDILDEQKHRNIHTDPIVYKTIGTSILIFG